MANPGNTNAPPVNANIDVGAQILQALMTLTQKVNALEAENLSLKSEKRPAPVAPKLGPWEEEIWAEAIRDCTYPDPHDPLQYGVYRYGRDRDGNPGNMFKLMFREHLIGNDAIRELKKGETPVVDKKVKIPNTANRGVRVQHLMANP